MGRVGVIKDTGVISSAPMQNDRIRTTVVGSYPKPADLLGSVDARILLDSGGSALDEQRTLLGDAEFTARLDRAVKMAIRDQVEAGIDIITDGEMRRGHYIHSVVRHMGGVDASHMQEADVRKIIRGQSRVAYRMKKPVVRSRITYAGPFLVDAFTFAQRLTTVPVKVTLPGPTTVADAVVDDYYSSAEALARDYAQAARSEVMALRDAGCRVIQFDDVALLRNLSRAEHWGIDALEGCFLGVDGITTVVHVCRSYPNKQLDELGIEYKSDQDQYPALLHLLSQSRIAEVSIEAKRDNLRPSVLANAGEKRILIGCIDVGSERVETEAEIVAQARAALAYLDRSQLILAPDCGMIQLARPVAQAKLARLAAAAAVLNREA